MPQRKILKKKPTEMDEITEADDDSGIIVTNIDPTSDEYNRGQYVFRMPEDHTLYDNEEYDNGKDIVDVRVSRADVLLFALVVVLIAQITILLFNIIETTIFPGAISRHSWAFIIITLVVIDIAWWITFANTQKNAIRHKTDLRRAYQIFSAVVTLHSIFCLLIIVPTAFTDSIPEERFREYLSIYSLTSGPTIVCGFYLGFESTKYT